MNPEERKTIIRQLLTEGRTLSQIQDYLRLEKGDSVTYMELRLLLSDMPDAVLPEKEIAKSEEPVAAESTPDKASPAGEAGLPGGSKVSISMDGTPAPGSMLSGYARFGSGAKAHWFLDSMGRLGLEPELGSEKPTKQDMEDFTTELKRMLQSG